MLKFRQLFTNGFFQAYMEPSASPSLNTAFLNTWIPPHLQSCSWDHTGQNQEHGTAAWKWTLQSKSRPVLLTFIACSRARNIFFKEKLRKEYNLATCYKNLFVSTAAQALIFLLVILHPEKLAPQAHSRTSHGLPTSRPSYRNICNYRENPKEPQAPSVQGRLCSVHRSLAFWDLLPHSEVRALLGPCSGVSWNQPCPGLLNLGTAKVPGHIINRTGAALGTSGSPAASLGSSPLGTTQNVTDLAARHMEGHQWPRPRKQSVQGDDDAYTWTA